MVNSQCAALRDRIPAIKPRRCEMQILIMLFSITMGIQSGMPLIQTGSVADFADLQVGFEICDILFIKADVVTYFDNSARGYGFAPFQADYTLNFGVNFDWLEIGFIHTCSHDITSSINNNIPVWTGEKLYITIKGHMALIK
jgi:hypothetical protein